MTIATRTKFEHRTATPSKLVYAVSTTWSVFMYLCIFLLFAHTIQTE